jgi:hypothetical protein
VLATILPPPLTIEYEYGLTPPEAENVVTLLTANVIAVGEMTKAAFTVTVAFDVFDKLSVTRTVTDPAVAGAVKAPVDELILPPPLTME